MIIEAPPDTLRQYTKDCIDHVERIVPEGFVVMMTYHPQSCPWDVYGNQAVRRTGLVLEAAGVDHLPCIIHRRNRIAVGSGPGGRKRFGDDMLPGIYRVAVREADKEKALAAIAAHEEDTRRWLHENGPMPDAYKP